MSSLGVSPWTPGDWHAVVLATLNGPAEDAGVRALAIAQRKVGGSACVYSDETCHRLRWAGPVGRSDPASAAASAISVLDQGLRVAGVRMTLTELRVLTWEAFAAETFPDGLPDWLTQDQEENA